MLKVSLKHGRFILFFLLGIALPVYFLNLFTPMILDDCNYATGIDGRIGSLTDIIKSQAWDYTVWSGRVVSHAIVQFFCGITGKWLFNILNPMMYVAFIFLLCRHVNVRNRNLPPALICFWMLAVAWFFVPDQFITTHLIAGSLNYLWASVLILGYIWFFTEHAVKNKNPKVGHLILFVIFSFLCGAFVEFYSVSVFFALLVWMFANRIKPNKTILICLAGFFLGLLFIVLAPGNYVRMELTDGVATLGGKISTFVFNGFFGNKIFWVLIALATLFMTTLLRRRVAWLFFKENALFLTAIIVSLGFGFVSGAGWARVFFPVFVFSIILFFKLLLTFRWNRILAYTLSVPLLVALVWSYGEELSNIRENKNLYDNLVAQLPACGDAAMLRKGSDFIESKNTFGNNALQMQPDYWANVVFAKYYNKTSISVLPSELYDHLYLKPHYVDDRFKLLDNCYTDSDLDYYIIPLDADIRSVKKVVLRYEEINQPVVRPVILMLFGKSFVTKLLGKAINNGFGGKIFCKMKPTFATFTHNEGNEPYAVISCDSGSYLVVRKPVGYEDDTLIGIDINE